MSFKHTDEFKRQILALREAGHSEYDLRKRYKLGHSTISRWAKQFADEAVKAQLVHPASEESTMYEDQMRDMKTQLDKALSEIDILKAAVAYMMDKKKRGQ